MNYARNAHYRAVNHRRNSARRDMLRNALIWAGLVCGFVSALLQSGDCVALLA